jgi:hypothetical protein
MLYTEKRSIFYGTLINKWFILLILCFKTIDVGWSLFFSFHLEATLFIFLTDA